MHILNALATHFRDAAWIGRHDQEVTFWTGVGLAAGIVVPVCALLVVLHNMQRTNVDAKIGRVEVRIDNVGAQIEAMANQLRVEARDLIQPLRKDLDEHRYEMAQLGQALQESDLYKVIGEVQEDLTRIHDEVTAMRKDRDA